LICNFLSHKASFMSVSDPKFISQLKVNLSLLRSNMPLNATENGSAYIHTFLTLALGGCEWSVRTSYCTSLGHSPQCVLDSSRNGLRTKQKGNLCHFRKSTPQICSLWSFTTSDSPAQSAKLTLIKMSPIVMA